MLLSQPSFVLSFALAFGLIGATGIAHAALGKTIAVRALRAFTCVGAIGGIVCPVAALNLRINVTPSMPIGVYRLTPLVKYKIERGMIVAVCAPLNAAELGRRRAYLGSGPCPADTEPLLKIVAAVTGDNVDILPRGVVVNGWLLPKSRPLSADAAGRFLRPWPRIQYRLRPGQLWLYAADDRSWDSRYWGPVYGTEVLARSVPLVTIRR